MRVELEVTDEMEDAIIVESLKWHIAHSDQDEVDMIAALKLVLEYYGGA